MNPRSSRNQPWLLLGLALLGVLILLEKQGTTRIFHTALSSMLSITNTIAAPIKHTIHSWHSWNYLRHQCQYLEEENSNLVNENVALRSVVHRQEGSKLLASFEGRYRHAPHTMARILSTERSPLEQYCIIDKGSNDGVEEEMCAVHKTQLLGKVVKVYPTHSKVMLITDKNCKVSIFIAGANVHGICEGINETNTCRIRFIEEPQKLTLGSMVITNGKGVIFPEGFLVGFLTRATPNAPDSPSEWFLEASPRLSADSLEFCHLVPHRQAKES